MQRARRRKPRAEKRFFIHPTFLVAGIWYCFKGELFLFLMSCVIALQHECAHAFAAARLGYRLNRVVLMPFGAVIDGDLRAISQKDEIYVALCGPLCNLFTAFFFGAVWWFAPTVYAFTDTAFYASLSIALVNLLPAYPLDGGRVLRCLLSRKLLLSGVKNAELTAERICRAIALLLAAALAAVCIAQFVKGNGNPTLLFFSGFLFIGALGNKDGAARYEKIDFSCKNALQRGVELRRVAVTEDCAVKDTLKYLVKGAYLVLEVYNDREEKLFELPQNELSTWFLRAPTPYTTLKELKNA